MSHKTEIATAVGTLACAVGIGFVMQSGEVAELRYGSTATISDEVVAQSTVLLDKIEIANLPFLSVEPELAVNDITLTSAEDDTFGNLPSIEEPVLILASAASPLYEPAAPEIRPKHVCPVTLSAETFAAAMVKLSVTAPCLRNERVVVRHKDLEFTETTSTSGGLDLTVPALAEEAIFDVAFVNGQIETATTFVPTITLYDRVVVQWQGENTVQLHAREYGADYGDRGHIWAGAMRDLSVVAGGNSGFLTRHGDNSVLRAAMAEIYTYPVQMAEDPNAIRFSIETEVTPSNCGREVTAKVLKLMGGTLLPARSVSLAVPGCGAVGNFLVLNNPLQDLTVAEN